MVAKLDGEDAQFLARQRLTTRCLFCGEELGHDLSLSESRAAIVRHSREAHPKRAPSERQRRDDVNRAERQRRDEMNRERRASATAQVRAALGQGWLSTDAIAKEAGIAQPTARRRLGHLEAAGEVERRAVERRGGKRLEWRLIQAA